MVEVHELKYDAAQDLQLYMNSNGAHVQLGQHCTIKGNHCAMIEDPLSYDWKTRASMQRPLTSPRGIRSRNSQNCTCAQTCATQRTVTEQIGTCASGGETHQNIRLLSVLNFRSSRSHTRFRWEPQSVTFQTDSLQV